MSEHPAADAPDAADPTASEGPTGSDSASGAAAAGPVVHEFVADGPIDLNVQNLRGRIEVRAEHGTAVRVELSPRTVAGRELVDRMTVRFEHGRLSVDVPQSEAGFLGAGVGGFFRSFSGDGAPFSDRLADGVRSLVSGAEGLTSEIGMEIVVPTGSRVVLTTGFGDLRVSGVLARLDAKTGAGDVDLERSAEERTRAATGKGDVAVGPVRGDADLKSGMGAVRAADVDARLAVTCGAGDVRIVRAVGGRLELRTGKGEIEVSVARGTAVNVDLATGLGERDVRLTPAEGAFGAERTLVVDAKTGMGDVRLLRVVS